MTKTAKYINLGALWKATGSVNVPLTGKIGDAEIMIAKNEKKEAGSNQPDYRILIVAPEYEEKTKEVTEELDDEIGF